MAGCCIALLLRRGGFFCTRGRTWLTVATVRVCSRPPATSSNPSMPPSMPPLLAGTAVCTVKRSAAKARPLAHPCLHSFSPGLGPSARTLWCRHHLLHTTSQAYNRPPHPQRSTPLCACTPPPSAGPRCRGPHEGCCSCAAAVWPLSCGRQHGPVSWPHAPPLSACARGQCPPDGLSGWLACRCCSRCMRYMRMFWGRGTAAAGLSTGAGGAPPCTAAAGHQARHAPPSRGAGTRCSPPATRSTPWCAGPSWAPCSRPCTAVEVVVVVLGQASKRAQRSGSCVPVCAVQRGAQQQHRGAAEQPACTPSGSP